MVLSRVHDEIIEVPETDAPRASNLFAKTMMDAFVEAFPGTSLTVCRAKVRRELGVGEGLELPRERAKSGLHAVARLRVVDQGSQAEAHSLSSAHPLEPTPWPPPNQRVKGGRWPPDKVFQILALVPTSVASLEEQGNLFFCRPTPNLRKLPGTLRGKR